MPILSIYIPTFNRVAHLIELLNALAYQLRSVERASVEIVVSDNASNDQTKMTISEGLKQGLIDASISHRFNRGADRNILDCFKYTSGSYVWILCDDDLPAPGAIEIIKKIITNDCELQPSFLYLNRTIESLDGRVYMERVTDCEEGIETNPRKVLHCPGLDLLTASTLVLKRRESLGPYAKIYGTGGLVAPFCLALDALSEGHPYLSSIPLVRYREGDKSGWLHEWPAISNIRIPELIRRFCSDNKLELGGSDSINIPGNCPFSETR